VNEDVLNCSRMRSDFVDRGKSYLGRGWHLKLSSHRSLEGEKKGRVVRNIAPSEILVCYQSALERRTHELE